MEVNVSLHAHTYTLGFGSFFVYSIKYNEMNYKLKWLCRKILVLLKIYETKSSMGPAKKHEKITRQFKLIMNKKSF